MEKEHKEYLDKLRRSGQVNMYGASSYLMARFGLDRYKAVDILEEWMESFSG